MRKLGICNFLHQLGELLGQHWKQQTGAAVVLTLPSLVVVPATVLDFFLLVSTFLTVGSMLSAQPFANWHFTQTTAEGA